MMVESSSAALHERTLILRLARAALCRHEAALRARGGETPRQPHAPTSEPKLLLEPGTPAAQTELALREADVHVAHKALGEHLAATHDARLGRLRAALDLDELDLVLVALLAAPELDSEFERAYAFAWSDLPRRRLDVRFVAELAGGTDERRRDAVMAHLTPTSRLRRREVVALDADGVSLAFGARGIRLTDRVMAFLRGIDIVDESIAPHMQIVADAPATSDLVIPPATIDFVRTVLHLHDGTVPHHGPAYLVLHGQPGTGRALLVTALHNDLGRPVVRADLTALAASPDRARRVAAVLREAALRDACCVFERVPELDDASAGELVDVLRDAPVSVVFVADGRTRWLAAISREVVELDVPPPTFRERVRLWRNAVPVGVFVEPSDLEGAAARYAFTAGVIAQAAGDAARTAMMRTPLAPRISLEDLSEASRRAFSSRLGELAQRIPPAFSWSDLVLGAETTERLQELVRFARLRPFLLEDWGFAAKLPYGRGISAILAGPPGTGKTMVAQLLARELGYDLYRIDLSQVVNKYIGETEKNLGRIFSEAESAHAILFFDEADALFAKRTEVKSSNDRYANLEVNYLLQRMETYDGVTLLATNIEQGIDPAFKRRVRFSIQFEMPDAHHRERLWRSMFPPQVPVAPDLDWRRVAEKFEMSGGYIKKAALRAALAIAESGRPLQTSDLVAAALHEYREMGRVV